MKCLLIVNTQSGNTRNAPDEGAFLVSLKKKYEEVKTLHLCGGERVDLREQVKGFDRVIAMGGDGTLSSVLNAIDLDKTALELIPRGTCNDSFRSIKSTEKSSKNRREICVKIKPLKFNERLFSYVAATGTFTPIGYLPSEKSKKLFGRLAYLYYAFKEYKVWNLDARINIDGEIQNSVYTLIMAVKSKYVFSLPLNRAYSKGDVSPKILLIKSPVGAFKNFKLFLLFFRCFFMGFNAPYESKNILFKSFQKVGINLQSPQPFCIDGERENAVMKAEVEECDGSVSCVMDFNR